MRRDRRAWRVIRRLCWTSTNRMKWAAAWWKTCISAVTKSRTPPDREEAGTPNIIIGAVQLGAANVPQTDRWRGFTLAEQQRLRQLFTDWRRFREYGSAGDPDLDCTLRLGTVAFNLDGLDHVRSLYWNDYHNVAVRNDSFCAHPYVRELLEPEPVGAGS
ncbi:MAG: hypothetical protein IPL99_15360 [Candidatus Competibacteraceae bacterium]|nr:hypothetical protein [Candidatus Competibacteraceae bacterium]